MDLIPPSRTRIFRMVQVAEILQEVKLLHLDQFWELISPQIREDEANREHSKSKKRLVLENGRITVRTLTIGAAH